MPTGWRSSRLRYLLNEVNDRSSGGETLLAASQELGVVPRDQLGYEVWNPGDDVSLYKRADVGDFVISLRSFQGGFERVNASGILSPAYTVLCPLDHANERFLRWFFKSQPFIAYLDSRTTGIRQGKTVQWRDCRDLAVQLPPPHVSPAIADFLDRESARISSLDEKVDRAARTARKGHWAQQAARLLNPSEHTIRLKYLVEQPVNGAWGSEPGEDEVDVACVRVADFRRPALIVGEAPTTRSISAVQVKRLSLRRGDLLLEKSGGGEASPVGFVARVEFDGVAVSSNFIGRIRARPGHSSLYLSHLFGTLYALRRNEPFVKQVTGIQNLDTAAYLSLRVPERPLEKQEKLAKQAEGSLQRVMRLEATTADFRRRAEQYREALITEAVTGQLDVSRVGEAQMDERLHAAAEAAS